VTDLFRPVDGTLLRWLVAHRTPALDTLMWAFTQLGRAGTVWLVLGIVAAALRRASVSGVWQMGLALLLTLLVSDGVLKPVVHRARPYEVMADLPVLGDRPGNASFPSGHAASSFAAAFSLSRAWPAARVSLWTLAVLISFSRMYLGAHYPTDVGGGALVGLACAILVVGRTSWFRKYGGVKS
jgi:undecaprenyl-diphosphatase